MDDGRQEHRLELQFLGPRELEEPGDDFVEALDLRGDDVHVLRQVELTGDDDAEAAMAPDGLIQAADMAMYRVKQSGRNGIQAAIAPTES